MRVPLVQKFQYRNVLRQGLSVDYQSWNLALRIQLFVIRGFVFALHEPNDDRVEFLTDFFQRDAGHSCAGSRCRVQLDIAIVGHDSKPFEIIGNRNLAVESFADLLAIARCRCFILYVWSHMGDDNVTDTGIGGHLADLLWRNMVCR